MKKTGALEGAFAKTKKASDEPVKSNSVSSVKELKPKEGNSPEKKSLSVNSGSKKAKAGGIANFFAAKPKVVVFFNYQLLCFVGCLRFLLILSASLLPGYFFLSRLLIFF